MHKTHIRADKSWVHMNWRELWEYRDLLLLMIGRDLTSIYKQTVLGPLWHIIQPLTTTVVFTIVFGKVGGLSTDGVPHFIFYMSGTILWNYFQGVLNYGAGSLIGNAHIFSKVYFPRLVVPLSGVFINLAHLLLNYIIFVGFYVYFLFAEPGHMQPNHWVWLQPVLVLECALMGLGFGLVVSALTIKYRDLRFALSFVSQLWMYATPVVYPASLVVTPHWKLLLWLNPMTAVIEFSRYGLTGHGTADLAGLGLSWVSTLIVMFCGLSMFNHVQRNFVDTI